MNKEQENKGTREQGNSEQGTNTRSARAEQEDAAREQTAALRARQITGRGYPAEENKEIYEGADAFSKFLARHCAKTSA